MHPTDEQAERLAELLRGFNAGAPSGNPEIHAAGARRAVDYLRRRGTDVSVHPFYLARAYAVFFFMEAEASAGRAVLPPPQ